jgi:hypothetical protein
MSEQVEEVRMADGAIFAFDGRVLEIFGQGTDSRRIHAATIEKLETSESMLEVKPRGESGTFFGIEGDQAQRAALGGLLARVQAASSVGGG